MPPTDSMPIMPYPAFYVGRFASVAAEIEARDTQSQMAINEANSKQVEGNVEKVAAPQPIAKLQPSELSSSNTTTPSQTKSGGIDSKGRLNLLA